jgi:hypothetical protein
LGAWQRLLFFSDFFFSSFPFPKTGMSWDVLLPSNCGRFGGLWFGHGIFHDLKEVGALLFGKQVGELGVFRKTGF